MERCRRLRTQLQPLTLLELPAEVRVHVFFRLDARSMALVAAICSHLFR